MSTLTSNEHMCLSGPVIGSNLLFARGFRENAGHGRYAVPLSDVRRFGRCHRYCDNRAWNIGELITGEIVHFMQKDQSPDMLKIMRKRLKSAKSATYPTRDNPEILSWEQT